MSTPINGALPPPKQIRFVNNQGKPPSKRRRINAAYVPFPATLSPLSHARFSVEAVYLAPARGLDSDHRGNSSMMVWYGSSGRVLLEDVRTHGCW
jgi:hypothetical protein